MIFDPRLYDSLNFGTLCCGLKLLTTALIYSDRNHTSSSKLLENPFSKIPIKQLLEETEEFQNNDEEFMNLQIKPAKLWEIPENNGPSMQCHVCFEYFWSAGRLAYHIIAVHEKNDTKRNNETVSEIPKIENNSKNHSIEPETNIKQEFDTGNVFQKQYFHIGIHFYKCILCFEKKCLLKFYTFSPGHYRK